MGTFGFIDTNCGSCRKVPSYAGMLCHHETIVVPHADILPAEIDII
jgi:hypothetical protein